MKNYANYMERLNALPDGDLMARAVMSIANRSAITTAGWFSNYLQGEIYKVWEECQRDLNKEEGNA